MIKFFLVLFSFLYITGCSTISDYIISYKGIDTKTTYSVKEIDGNKQYISIKEDIINYVNDSGKKTTDIKTHFYTGIQWTSFYVVVTSNPCENICDIYFVSNKSSHNLPDWRDRKPNEKLQVVGNSILGETFVINGVDVDKKVPYKYNYEAYVAFSNSMHYNTPLFSAPVYGEDGKIVGILNDTRKNNEIKEDLNESEKQNIFVFISYDAIKQAWLKFQKEKNELYF